MAVAEVAGSTEELVRFLFVPYSIAGHVHPVLPVVAELVDRGHQVRLLVGERYAESVRSAGAEVIELAQVPVVIVPERFFGRLTWRYLGGRLRRWQLNRRAGRLLDEQLQQLDERVVVVVDPMLSWADRIIRRYSLPTVTFSMTIHQGPAELAELARLDGLRMPSWIHGMRPLAKRSHHQGRLVLTNSLAELHPTGREIASKPPATGREIPPELHFVGPLLGNRAEVDIADPSAGGPTLLVSPGTVFARDRPFFDKFIRAFDGQEWQVFIATGHLDPAELGALPTNVVARRFLPQRQLLARSAVFATHAGMNSVQEGLSAGVPMLLFPRCAEQRHLARCLVAGGVGVWPRAEPENPAALFQQVQALAANPHVRENLRVWQARMTAGGGAQRAADLLEAWAVGQSVGASTDPSASRPAV